jgi:hypothetical protein
VSVGFKSFQCAGCRDQFLGSRAFGLHLRLHSACVDAEAAAVVQRPKKHRTRRTIDFKCRVLSDLAKLEMREIPFAQTVLLRSHEGVSKQDLSRWSLARASLFTAQENNLGHKRYLQTISRVEFPECEDELYVRFILRRENIGLKTEGSWLQQEMRVVLEEVAPKGWEDHRCSNGWLSGFNTRYAITDQARTNKKELPVVERLPLIRNFHQWFLHGVQRSSPQTCPRYGRYAATVLFHMDQIPLPFVLDSSRSLNGSGRPCYIFQPPGDLDKRQASVQLCIRAEGDQIVRPALILRGTGMRMTQPERAVYELLSPFISVYFQPKAWCDGQIALAWLDQFQEETAHLGDRVLGMDQHGAQKTQACRQKMTDFKIFPAYTPEGFIPLFFACSMCITSMLGLFVYRCTDVASPCDHHVGMNLKTIMGWYYKQDSEASRDAWCLPPGLGGLHQWQRRVKMAMWLAAAWTILREKAAFLRQSFVSTGTHLVSCFSLMYVGCA